MDLKTIKFEGGRNIMVTESGLLGSWATVVVMVGGRETQPIATDWETP